MFHRPPVVEPSAPVDVINADTVDEVFDDIAGHMNAQHGRLIDTTVWLLANPAKWQGDRLHTPAQYLSWRNGASPNTAANIVLAARRASELPSAMDAIRCGELSLDQLMPIVRGVPAWADGQVVSLAVRLTVPQIQRLIRDTDFDWQPGIAEQCDVDEAEQAGEPEQADEPDAGEPLAADSTEQPEHDPGDTSPVEPPSDQNRVSYGYRDNGRWYLYADLDTDLGELVETSLTEARDALFQQRNNTSSNTSSSDTGAVDADQTSSPANSAAANNTNVSEPVSNVDALVELANRSLDTIVSTSRRNRYRINLHLNTAGALVTEHGIALPDSLADHLTCDGTLDPVHIHNGLPISVGRTQRTIPDRTRRTVLKRDHRCCQVPGCTTSQHLDIHHIIHWSKRGPTSTHNLITLCSRHHRLHHQHKLGIAGNADQPDTLVFTNSHGRPIKQSGANPTPPTGPPPPTRGNWQHPYGEPLQRQWVTFTDPTLNSERGAA